MNAVVVEEVPERTNADRTIVLQELQSIEERDGIVTPEAVVDFAEDESTELHKIFEWDDTKAAHDHRLWQARQVIRAVVVDLNTSKGRVKVKAYVHFEESEISPQGYVSMVRVLSDVELRNQMLKTAKRELQFFRKKYSDLQELTNVFNAIDSL